MPLKTIQLRNNFSGNFIQVTDELIQGLLRGSLLVPLAGPQYMCLTLMPVQDIIESFSFPSGTECAIVSFIKGHNENLFKKVTYYSK